jgi:hypothetical protein
MMPFELELAARDKKPARCSRATDFLDGKTVPAVRCLFVNAPQVLCNVTDRGTLLSKPKKLRVMNVAVCPSPEDGLREKSFPPQSD